MFGVLIELPEQICVSESSERSRCDLSYYIQVVCLGIIVPLCLIKNLRLAGIDGYRLLIEIVTFVSGVVALDGP
jgi:hypothetical protein